MKEFITGLGEGYRVVSPIEVEVTASAEGGKSLYWAYVTNLHNELVFGVGRTKSSAIEMLKESLTSYFDKLMSSDLERYYADDLLNFQIDKEKLMRIIRIESTT